MITTKVHAIIFNGVIVVRILVLEHCRISYSQTQLNRDYNKIHNQGNINIICSRGMNIKYAELNSEEIVKLNLTP